MKRPRRLLGGRLQPPRDLAIQAKLTISGAKGNFPLFLGSVTGRSVWRAVAAAACRLDCQSILVGGVENHVHLLSTLSRTCQPAELVKEVKRGSSLRIKEREQTLRDFGWQNGYGIFSLGFSQIKDVRDYIAGQEAHHRKASFQDEFRALLRRYEIAFDERYVWD
jgi:REP element-mobilizing transposase RayT